MSNIMKKGSSANHTATPSINPYRRRGGDRIYEMRCLFVAVGPNARFKVLPHWDNMSC